MTYEIVAPAVEGTETWFIWMVCIVVFVVAIVVATIITFKCSNAVMIERSWVILIAISVAVSVWYVLFSSGVRSENFSDNVVQEFQDQQYIEVFTEDWISRGGMETVAFATEDGIMRTGDMYYDRDTNKMILVERQND